MKKVTSLASSAVLFLAAISAAAEPAGTPSTTSAPGTPRPIVPPPPFAALPAGSTTVPPTAKPPARIPASEKVEGFHVGTPPKEQREDGKITQVMLFSKEEDAKEFATRGFSVQGANDPTVCFSQEERMRFLASEEEPPPAEWNAEIEPTARISAPMKRPPPRKKGDKASFKPSYGELPITAIHQERFFQEEKKARVEIVDAWVDPVTHGVRLIAKKTIPLERIGSAWRGVRLYAARGEKVVHVVARRDRPKEANVERPTKSLEFRLQNALRQPLRIEKPSGEQDHTQCGFAHVQLKAEPGAAETAMFETNTVFVERVEPARETDKGEEERRAQFPFLRGMDEDGPALRVRPFRATVSSTWSSKDTAPVLSVSFGWAGREREM